MDRRRLLILSKGGKFNPEDALFSGTCTAKTVNIYYGAYSGADKVHYIQNEDGTYNYYVISPDGKKQWWDRFVWYNSNGVKTLKVAEKAEISELNNNRFNSAVSLESIDFAGYTIVTKSLRESFYNLPKLKSLNISSFILNSCTSMCAMLAQNIGSEDTEANITALRNVYMPDQLVSKATEVHKMFAWNRGLTRITGMTYWEFPEVTNFSEMFCECRALKDVTFVINNWVTSSATDIHSMFLQCFKLDLSTLGDFTKWDVQNVTDFSFCFARTGTTSLDLSKWNFNSATNIEGMFMQETSINAPLKTLNLSGIGLNPNSLTNHENLFSKCSNLQQIDLTEVNNQHGIIEFIEEQLLVDIPTEVKAGSVHVLLDDGVNTYDEEHNQGWVPDNRVIGLVMAPDAEAPSAYNYIHDKDDNLIASKINDDYNITAEDIATIPTGGSKVTKVIFDARCIWPDAAQTSANTFFKECLNGLTGLTDVYLLGVDDAVVLAIKTSNFGGSDTSILSNIKVHTDKGIFVFKNNLWTLYDDSDEAIVFADSKVEAICVSNWGSDGKITKAQAAKVTSLNKVFQSQPITSFDELKYFTGVTSLADNEFNECTSLKSLYLDNITESIGSKALRSTGLTGELTIKAKTIGGVFLSNNSGITRVNLPNVTSFGLGTPTGYSFNYCDALKILDFGSGLNSLVDPNFGISSQLLKTIIFRGDIPSNSGFTAYSASQTATYYVPDEYLSNWQAKYTKLTFKPFSEAPDGLL